MQKPIVVFTGASTSGKTTLCNYLIERYGFARSSTCTTRPRRCGEECDSYIFLTEQQFEAKVMEKEMLEYVRNFGYYYGSPAVSFERDESIVLAMTSSGAKIIKERYPSRTIVIFLHVSLATVLQRIKSRDLPLHELQARLKEIKEINENECDYTINGDQPLPAVYASLDKVMSELLISQHGNVVCDTM